MIVVDQLSQELLDRYADLYAGGFRRLLDHGRVYVNATHDYGATKTAPGHATLSTGVYPSRHGIIANEWYERSGDGWVEISNVGDSSARIVGHPDLPGVSPHRLMRSGFADWLRDAEPRSIVASVSPKDRSAVLPAAHVRGHVFWFEPTIGRFVTSQFYADDTPEWLDGFHREELRAFTDDTVWASTVPEAARGRSSPDTAAHEGDGTHTFFPHRFSAEGRPGSEAGDNAAFWDWFEETPMLDDLTLRLAEMMVEELDLGDDEVPDFLNVSLSATDRVGHDYGPRSREQLDNLLRLDRELGEFFEFLDRTVGEGDWLVALSSDHGSAVPPEDLWLEGDTTSRRWTPEEEAALDSIRARADRLGADTTGLERTVAALESLGFVEDVWTVKELLETPPADSFAVLMSRSVYPGRVHEDFGREGVEVLFDAGWLEGLRGTEHGTPRWYDRHVPIVFLGPGIAAGRDSTRASTTDFAPTLAALLGLPVPEGVDGAPLAGALPRNR
jgi:predicted AlkP superfamily pyrophosphatase or phosphodiesterase